MPFFLPLETKEEKDLALFGGKKKKPTTPTPTPTPTSDPDSFVGVAKRFGSGLLGLATEGAQVGFVSFFGEIFRPKGESQFSQNLQKVNEPFAAVAEVGTQIFQTVAPDTKGTGSLLGDLKVAGETPLFTLPDASKITFTDQFTVRELSELNEARPFAEQLFGAIIFDPLNLIPGVGFTKLPRFIKNPALIRAISRLSADFTTQLGAFAARESRKPTLFEKIQILNGVIDETPLSSFIREETGAARFFGDEMEELAKLGNDAPEELEKARQRWQRYASQIDETDTPQQAAAMKKLAKEAEQEYSTLLEVAITKGRLAKGQLTEAEQVAETSATQLNEVVSKPPVEDIRNAEYDTQLNLFNDVNPVPGKGKDMPTTVGESHAIGDNVAEAIIDGETSRAYVFDPEARTLFDLDAGVKITLTNSEKITNKVKALFRRLDWPAGPDIDARVASMFRTYDEGLRVADSQASRMEAKFQALISENFPTLTKKGQLDELKGIDPELKGLAPTLEDVAAKLPLYEASNLLDHKQVAAFRAMEELFAPFRNTALNVGIDLGKRPDIIEGGFYLPRGRALLDDFEVTVTRSVRGKAGVERAAKFPSKAEGLEHFDYGNLTTNMKEATFGLSRRALDEHVVRFFKRLKDDDGDLILETSKQRLLRQEPALLKAHEALRKHANNLKAMDRRLANKASIKLQEFLDDIEFDDIDALREELTTAMKVSRGKYKGAERTRILKAQAEVRQAIQAMAPAWRKAKVAAQNPAVEQASIRFQGLEQYAGPRAFVNAINKEVAKLARTDPNYIKWFRATQGALRGMQATLDLSGAFIQGMLAFHNDQVAFGKAFKTMFQALADPNVVGKHLNDLDVKAIQSGLPTSETMADVGVHFSGGFGEMLLGGQKQGLEILGKLPIIKQANRAFSSFGDILRAEWFSDLYKEAGKHGERIVTREEMEEIAKFVNQATGWSARRTGGDVGELLLFAPRFFQSRLETLTSAVRGIAPGASIKQRHSAKSMIRMVAQGAAITYGVNAMFGNETDNRPVIKIRGKWQRNSNFMRMRVPGIEQDVSIFGTWDSLLGMFLIVGTAGTNKEAWDGFQFLRFSSSPAVSTAWDFISGRDFDGNRTRDTGQQVIRRLLKNVESFFLQDLQRNPWSDLKEGYHQKDANKILRGFGRAGLQFFAVKATPFTFNDIAEDIIGDLSEKGEIGAAPDTRFTELSPQDRKAVTQHPDYVNARAARRELKQAATPLNATEASIKWETLRKQYDAQIMETINSGAEGKSLRLGLQAVMTQRSGDARMLFETLAGERDAPDLETLSGARRAYWSIPVEIDPKTGRPDFRAREEQRNVILQKLIDLGFDPKDVTDRFDFSENAEVNTAVEVYHLSQDILKPYWTLTDTITSQWPPQMQEIWARYETADDTLKPLMAGQYPFVEALSKQRKLFRSQNPMVDLLLVWWGYAGKPVTPAASKLYIQRAQNLLSP